MVRRVNFADSPAPSGAYAQAVASNGFLFTAGVGPVDPETGSIVEGGIGVQTRQVMQNLLGLLRSEGLTFNDVVKSTVHLLDAKRDFADFDATYRTYFGEELPARTTVGSDLISGLIELDVVAAYAAST